jgi:hypothetical protein
MKRTENAGFWVHPCRTEGVQDATSIDTSTAASVATAPLIRIEILFTVAAKMQSGIEC